jgi:microcystin-dependent protein
MNNNNTQFPSPSIDQLDWGEPLSQHIRQLLNPNTGGINTYEGDITNTSLLGEGYTFIDTKNKSLKRWKEGSFETLIGGITVVDETPEEGEYQDQIIYNTTEQAILRWLPNPNPNPNLPTGSWEYLVGGINTGLDLPPIYKFEPPLENNFFFRLDASAQWVNSSIPTGKIYEWTGFEWKELAAGIPFGSVMTTQAGPAYLAPTGSEGVKLFTVISNTNKATIYKWNDVTNIWVLLGSIIPLNKLVAVNGNINAGSILPEPIRIIKDGYKFIDVKAQKEYILQDGEWVVLLHGVDPKVIEDINTDIDDLTTSLNGLSGNLSNLDTRINGIIQDFQNDLANILVNIQTQVDNATSIPAGQYITSASPTAPAGYLLPDGREVSKTTYSKLYAAIGDIYNNHPTLGGASAGNFRLPDRKGRFGLGVAPDNPLGQYGGEAQVALTEANNGPHTHAATAQDSGHTHSVTGTNRRIGDDNNATLLDAGGTRSTDVGYANISVSVAGSGSGAPHNNIPPYLTEYVYIKY